MTMPASMRGVVLALISTALFVAVGVLVRILNERIAVVEILLFRQLIFILLLMPVISRSMDLLLKPQQVGLHLLRVLGAFLALYLGFVTVSHIPLADATALGFTQVLFVAVIARYVLSEQVGPQRVFTIVVGFIGVMLIVQPAWTSVSMIYVISGLMAALGAAIAVTCVRHLSQTESKLALLTYQALLIAMMALIPSISVWEWPSFEEMILLILVGVISSLAQWVGVSAYQLGQANLIANVEYSKILYALLLGYVFFDEWPNPLAWVGVFVLLLSPVLPRLYTHIRSRMG